MLASSGARLAGDYLPTLLLLPQDTFCWNVWWWKVLFNSSFSYWFQPLFPRSCFYLLDQVHVCAKELGLSLTSVWLREGVKSRPITCTSTALIPRSPGYLSRITWREVPAYQGSRTCGWTLGEKMKTKICCDVSLFWSTRICCVILPLLWLSSLCRLSEWMRSWRLGFHSFSLKTRSCAWEDITREPLHFNDFVLVIGSLRSVWIRLFARDCGEVCSLGFPTPNREAECRVRKGVGLWTNFWAVVTPVPDSLSHPIHSTGQMHWKGLGNSSSTV